MENIYNILKKEIKKSYSVYSNFATCALVETDKGSFIGINIENSSYSLTVCAERVAIFNAIANGAKKFKCLYLLSNSRRNDIIPCGACLQVMSEFFNSNTPIIVFNSSGKSKQYEFKDLLKITFTKKNLSK